MPALSPERPGCPKAPGRYRPLPDPAAVRLYLVPDSAPPYDDEVPAGEPGRGLGASDNARPADGGRPADEGRPADGGRLAHEGRPARGGPVAGRPASGAPVTGRPAAGVAPGWQSRFAQVLAETLAGSRPPRQIVPWTTQQAREHIQRLGPQMASVQRPRIRRVVTHRPASDVMEMAVVVGFGPRVRALAVRLERSPACPPAGLGGTAGPGGSADPVSPVSPGRPAVRGGVAGRGEPAERWVCTAVEAA
jgi:Family of unknown function (DUF6459)